MSTRTIKSNNNIGRPQIIKSALNKKSIIQKAENQVNLDGMDTIGGGLIAGEYILLPTPFPIDGLQTMVDNSTILQQCITAYKRNIVGFGAKPNYILNELQEKRRDLEARLNPPEAQEGTNVGPGVEENINGSDNASSTEETPEMVAEWEIVDNFIKFFNFDQSFEGLMSDIIEDREQTGNGYMEILRDGSNMPVGGHRVNPRNVQCTSAGGYIEVEHRSGGKMFTRKRKFRRYCQQVGANKVWFKELGDPRIMDSRNGNYVEGQLDVAHQANEIWHLKIGTGAYGLPRWIGQLIHMYGARKAEELNLRYFEQGRHTPMAIVVSNGQLSPQSDEEIAAYLDTIEGVEKSHGFLVIEAEGNPSDLVDGKEESHAKVELKSLADVIQKDALFLDYDNRSREKVQSAFALPDIYVGRSQDFNRATSETAKEITEEQVFIPERKEIEWQINNRLLVDYDLVYTELEFKKPETANVDETHKLIELLLTGKAVSTNELRDLLGQMLGKELDALGPEHDKVGSTTNTTEGSGNPSPGAQDPLALLAGLEIAKAKGNTKEELLYYNDKADRVVNAVTQYLKKQKEFEAQREE